MRSQKKSQVATHFCGKNASELYRQKIMISVENAGQKKSKTDKNEPGKELKTPKGIENIIKYHERQKEMRKIQ